MKLKSVAKKTMADSLSKILSPTQSRCSDAIESKDQSVQQSHHQHHSDYPLTPVYSQCLCKDAQGGPASGEGGGG